MKKFLLAIFMGLLLVNNCPAHGMNWLGEKLTSLFSQEEESPKYKEEELGRMFGGLPQEGPWLPLGEEWPEDPDAYLHEADFEPFDFSSGVREVLEKKVGEKGLDDKTLLEKYESLDCHKIVKAE